MDSVDRSDTISARIRNIRGVIFLYISLFVLLWIVAVLEIVFHPAKLKNCLLGEVETSSRKENISLIHILNKLKQEENV